MIKTLVNLSIILGIGYVACNNPKNTDSHTQKVETTNNKKTSAMKNLVSIVEIPTADFSRAVTFYQSILDISIEKVEMGDTEMGVFPSDGETVNVALLHGNEYKPSNQGTIVYLNAGNNLQLTLDKVVKNGGKVIVSKTQISPEMGFFALFTDTEGNKLGLHSNN